MLQGVTKTLKSMMSESFIKRLSQYLHDCVREEVKSSTFRNLKSDPENKWLFLDGEERVFSQYDEPLMLDGSSPKLTELMIQGDSDSKDKYLLYGFLFLVGKNSKAKKNNDFLTPLLYAPCSLERCDTKISLSLQDNFLSLNTGALAQLIKRNDEEEVDAMLSGLLDVVPELPLTQNSLDIFITTLRSLVPDLEIEMTVSDDNIQSDFYETSLDEFKKLEEDSQEDDFDSLADMSKAPKIKLEKLTLSNKQAVILTKRPMVTAGVLHELTQIGEKPSGIIRENVLNVINQEYQISKGKLNPKEIEKKELKDFFPITPLSLSDSQREVIEKIEGNELLAVYGPPGTGKSQTIVNLVAHLIANGKTVLVASRMDKAIDVVAQRLNSLNAPYLALRAGRANYQKQLNYKLQDLLSNKVDLDEEFEDSILVKREDMKTLLCNIKEVEEKIENVIKLEEKYTALESEMREFTIGQDELSFVTSQLTLSEIELIRKNISNIENQKTNGLIGSISKTLSESKIKKMLGLKNVKIENEFLRISFELDVMEYRAKLLKIEEEIYKIGNLHQLMAKLSNLKSKQKKLAVDILRNQRRNALKELLADQRKRQRLIVHSRSLVSKKALQQARILENEDFTPLLSTFPCWCTTTYAISNSIPLKSAMFDVVIIDEASQCDIASCFPLLYRAKKAVIVGDDKQLPHLSFLEKSKEQSFFNKYNIEEKYQLMWRFRTNSMFDLANYYSVSPVLLDEHFRSTRQIIEFSSNEFYGGRIKIMKPDYNDEVAVDVVEVEDGHADLDKTQNSTEAEAVISTLRDIVSDKNNYNLSIGVISPFRAQVDLIKSDILSCFSKEVIDRHKIDVGTAHTFQGDERDIMLISWTYSSNSHPQSLMFLQKANLFNVAITRARKKTINFVSRKINELPRGLLRDYFEYIEIQKRETKPNSIKLAFKNEFEREVWEELNALANKGEILYNVYSGLMCGGVSADIVIGSLVIECDGEEDNIRKKVSNAKKQAILERCGFKVIRVTKREWKISKIAVIERIKQCIN